MGESGTKLISVTVLTSIGTVTEILSYNRPEIVTLYFTFSAFGIFFKFGIGEYHIFLPRDEIVVTSALS
jgi:hypothetical protein